MQLLLGGKSAFPGLRCPLEMRSMLLDMHDLRKATLLKEMVVQFVSPRFKIGPNLELRF